MLLHDNVYMEVLKWRHDIGLIKTPNKGIEGYSIHPNSDFVFKFFTVRSCKEQKKLKWNDLIDGGCCHNGLVVQSVQWNIVVVVVVVVVHVSSNIWWSYRRPLLWNIWVITGIRFLHTRNKPYFEIVNKQSLCIFVELAPKVVTTVLTRKSQVIPRP